MIFQPDEFKWEGAPLNDIKIVTIGELYHDFTPNSSTPINYYWINSFNSVGFLCRPYITAYIQFEFSKMVSFEYGLDLCNKCTQYNFINILTFYVLVWFICGEW